MSNYNYKLKGPQLAQLGDVIEAYILSANSMLKQDVDIHNVKNCRVPDGHIDSLLEWVPNQMEQYSHAHRVKVQSIDLFKVYAWSGFYLAAISGHQYYVPMSVVLMGDLLEQENRQLPDTQLEKICKVAMKDRTYLCHKQNDEEGVRLTDGDMYAVGSNGVYMSFKAALSVKVLSGDMIADSE